MIAKRIEKRLTTLISGNINNTKKEDHILQMPGLEEFGSVIVSRNFHILKNILFELCTPPLFNLNPSNLRI